MEYSEVKQLLEKYFMVETSLQEEADLRLYFQNKDVPDDFKIYQSFFGPVELKEEMQLGGDFDDKILKLIDADETKKMKPLHHIYNALKVAAILILIISVAALMYNYSLKKNKTETTAMNTSKIIEDTYQDPELARQELEKALALLSSKMNKGKEMAAEKASKLQVISKAIETN